MRKAALCIAILMMFSSFGLNMFVQAGEMPTVPLTPTRVAGDADGSGKVNLADVTIVLRWLAGGWNVTINKSAADVNGDGAVTLKDATLVRRYIVGGWGVTLI